MASKALSGVKCVVKGCRSRFVRDSTTYNTPHVFHQETAGNFQKILLSTSAAALYSSPLKLSIKPAAAYPAADSTEPALYSIEHSIVGIKLWLYESYREP